MIKDTFPMIIGEEKVRSERTLLAGVENGKYMTSADSVRFLVLHCSASRCNQDYSVERVRMPDLIIDALSASAMRVVWMRKASLVILALQSRPKES